MDTDDPRNSKECRLREQGAFNCRADRVSDTLFQASEFFDPRDLVLVKYEMLRCVNVDKIAAKEAAKRYGFSRSGYYKVLSSFQHFGIAGLVTSRPGPREASKLTDEVMTFIERQLAQDSTFDSSQLVELVHQQFQLSIHRRSIERAIQRRQKKRSDKRDG